MDQTSALKRWRRLQVEVLEIVQDADVESDARPKAQDSCVSSNEYNEFGCEENQQSLTPHSSHESHNYLNQSSSCDTSGPLEPASNAESNNNNSSSSSSSDESDISELSDEHVEISAELGNWAIHNNLARSTINSLLDILRRHGHRLPKDARTLKSTPRLVNVEHKCGGEYCYIGIESGLLRLLTEDHNLCDNNEIKLMVNIDGVPLFKSSTAQFWPILCSFNSCAPFIVAIFSGNTKPNNIDEYLEDFLNEYLNLHDHNMVHEGNVYRVVIWAFICDAPARAFIKCIKGHTGYYACERCEIKGLYNHFIILHSTNELCLLRTEEKFMSEDYHLEDQRVSHQKDRSPLINAGISCVKGFPLDYMHLVCLGVVKRIITFFKAGPRAHCCGQSRAIINRISGNLMVFKGKMPSDFARQPRTLEESDRWKATEFRQFLLYTGPVVLKDVLPVEIYNHFLTLSVAVSIMLNECDEKRNAYLAYANNLMQYFVNKSSIIFGSTFPVYNVHSLIHLSQDVEHYQCSLNKISGFKFENYLQTLKKMIRGRRRPIAEVCKRLVELERVGSKKKSLKRVNFVSTKQKDSCFILGNERYAFIEHIHNDGDIVCHVLRQRFTENFYTTPCNSKLLNIVYVTKVNLQNQCDVLVLHRKDLIRKVVRLPYSEGWVLLPLLHDMECGEH